MLPQRIASVIGVCVLTASCTGSTPVEPSRVAADAGDLTTVPSDSRSRVQRVEEGGGGGGGQCLATPTTPICVTVLLRTDSISLVGQGGGTVDPASPLNFSARGGLGVGTGIIGITGDGKFIIGRFTGGTFELSVLNGSLNITVTLEGPFDNDRGFTASGKGSATQVQRCIIPSGATTGALDFITTSTVQLSHLGSTTIVVVRHSGVACTT